MGPGRVQTVLLLRWDHRLRPINQAEVGKAAGAVLGRSAEQTAPEGEVGATEVLVHADCSYDLCPCLEVTRMAEEAAEVVVVAAVG